MKKENNTLIIEYDIKLAVFRISILILFLVFSFFTISKIFFNDDEINNQSIFKIDEKNITGKFIPINKNLTISANIKIVKIDIFEYITIENLNISNNKQSEYEIYLASNWVGSQRIFLDKYNPIIKYYEFKMHRKLDYTVHKYIIIWDKTQNIPAAYAKLDLNQRIN